MFDSKTYELSLTRRYVSRWGMVEAVRELIQNALDSDSPFVYSFARGDDGLHVMSLQSEFTTLPASTLLLGSTSKADSSSTIGSFGEGYKIALLVLTRLGHEVVMRNGRVTWTPAFRMSKTFNEEILVVHEKPAAVPNKGLSTLVGGLTDVDVEQIKDSCIRMQDHIGAIKQTTYGDILLERKGELYVGGLFVCKTDLHFGYNILPAHVTLERDRQTVSSWDLQITTRDMWFETKEFDRIAKMIDGQVPDVDYAKYSSPEMVKEACYRLFIEQNPGHLVATSQSELKSKIAAGMTKYICLSEPMNSIVRSSKSYAAQEPTYKAAQLPHEFCKQWLSDNRREMRSKSIEAFKDLLKESEQWRHL